MARSEPVSDDAPDAGAAPARGVPPRDDQVAALQQLVAQSRQQSELLAQIDDHLVAVRQQAAGEESRRQAEASKRPRSMPPPWRR